jgi:hypothetical protein
VLASAPLEEYRERISQRSEGLRTRCCKRTSFRRSELVTYLAVKSAEEVVLSLGGLLLYILPSMPVSEQEQAASIAEIVLGAQWLVHRRYTERTNEVEDGRYQQFQKG